MNYWTDLSIQFASQRNYLDELFTVYPLAPDNIRELDKMVWSKVEAAYNKRNNIELINSLLRLKLFPIKDSYVSFLRRDKSAIERNPETVNRICSRLYELGLDKIYLRSAEPKEANRQMGQLFKNWIKKETLGLPLLTSLAFLQTEENAILTGTDAELTRFAKDHLNYNREKGLDFVARMHHKYIVGEAKFITDFGGHQDRQFDDGITLLRNTSVKAIKIALYDGVLYINGRSRIHKHLLDYQEENIFSSLLLRDFLYQI